MRITAIAGLAGLGLCIAAPLDAQRDTCALLTTAEVQQAFPGSKAGRPDRALEKQGIFRCRWEHEGGHLLIVGGDEVVDSPRDEAETWALAIADPVRGDTSRVRWEVLKGVGDDAVAVVERPDASKGLTQHGAFVVVRRGKQQVSLLAPNLARRDRAEALAVLTTLGKAVASRMGGTRGR